MGAHDHELSRADGGRVTFSLRDRAGAGRASGQRIWPDRRRASARSKEKNNQRDRPPRSALATRPGCLAREQGPGFSTALRQPLLPCLNSGILSSRHAVACAGEKESASGLTPAAPPVDRGSTPHKRLGWSSTPSWPTLFRRSGAAPKPRHRCDATVAVVLHEKSHPWMTAPWKIASAS